MRWIAVVLLVVVAACSSGAKGTGDVIGSVRSGDTDFVVVFEKGFAKMSLRKGNEASLVLPLGLKADVDMAMERIAAGMIAETPAAGQETVVSRMNTGRPEMRLVAKNANGQRETWLQISNRADAPPAAPIFSFRLTDETRREVDAVLAKSRERLAR